MQPADVMVLGRDAVETAINRMNEFDHVSSWYVVDGEQKLEGLINKQRFMKKMKQGGVDKLHHVMERDIPRITKSTSLSDIYALCANGVPVAVTDRAGRLQGVVRPRDILASLAQQSENGEASSNGHGNGSTTLPEKEMITE
jgi:glycine betaine/proline transport system ATP-binding protein